MAFFCRVSKIVFLYIRLHRVKDWDFKLFHIEVFHLEYGGREFAFERDSKSPTKMDEFVLIFFVGGDRDITSAFSDLFDFYIQSF